MADQHAGQRKGDAVGDHIMSGAVEPEEGLRFIDHAFQGKNQVEHGNTQEYAAFGTDRFSQDNMQEIQSRSGHGSDHDPGNQTVKLLSPYAWLERHDENAGKGSLPAIPALGHRPHGSAEDSRYAVIFLPCDMTVCAEAEIVRTGVIITADERYRNESGDKQRY